MAYAHFKYTWLQCKFPHTFIWEGKKFPQISAVNWFSWIVLYSIGGFSASSFWVYFCVCFLLSQPLNLEPWEFHAFTYFPRAYSGPAIPVLWPSYHIPKWLLLYLPYVRTVREKPCRTRGTLLGSKENEFLLLQRSTDLFQNLLISVNTVKTISLSDHHCPGKKACKQKFINLVYLHDVLSSGNKSGSMCCQQDSVPRPVALNALELQQLLYWLLVKKCH